MDFWSTVAGYRLADVLTHCLPRIAEEHQYVLYADDMNMAAAVIAAEIQHGNVYIQHIVTDDNVMIILKKQR